MPQEYGHASVEDVEASFPGRICDRKWSAGLVGRDRAATPATR
jgi:hypothetical protein